MTKKDISNLQNFSERERDIFGRRIFDKYKGIDPILMKRIDYAVTLSKSFFPRTYFKVHDINQGRHSDETSLHYRGIAIDGHFEHLPIERQWFFCVLAGFKGIGVYFDWNNIGIHADIRDQDKITIWYRDGEYNNNRLDFMERLGF